VTELKMKNEKLKMSRVAGFFILHFAFCILHS